LAQVLDVEKDLLSFVFGNSVLLPYVNLLKEEFDDQIFSLILAIFKQKRRI
jgi:hypothetical protein